MGNYTKSGKLTFAYLRDSGYSEKLMKVDYLKIDVINYAFGKIVNNKLDVSHLTNLNEVLKLRQKGVKIVIVVDGVRPETRQSFIDISKTVEGRSVFINSLWEIIGKYQFDGVDLDWEYPNGDEQKNDFTLLCKEIKDKFATSKRNLLLTAAVRAGGFDTHYDLVELNKYLDFLHIMTYGMSDSHIAHHQSALYEADFALHAIEKSVMMYTNGGFDINRIVFGIPFYVRMGEVENKGAFPLGQKLINYRSIGYSLYRRDCFVQEGFVEYFDEGAAVFYGYNGTTFATYDNEDSVKLKCRYALDNNLAGVMFWDYGHDGLGGTLLEAIFEILK